MFLIPNHNKTQWITQFIVYPLSFVDIFWSFIKQRFYQGKDVAATSTLNAKLFSHLLWSSNSCWKRHFRLTDSAKYYAISLQEIRTKNSIIWSHIKMTNAGTATNVFRWRPLLSFLVPSPLSKHASVRVNSMKDWKWETSGVYHHR